MDSTEKGNMDIIYTIICITFAGLILVDLIDG